MLASGRAQAGCWGFPVVQLIPCLKASVTFCSKYAIACALGMLQDGAKTLATQPA